MKRNTVTDNPRNLTRKIDEDNRLKTLITHLERSKPKVDTRTPFIMNMVTF